MSDSEYAKYLRTDGEALKQRSLEQEFNGRQDGRGAPARGSVSETFFDKALFWVVSRVFLLALILLPAFVLTVYHQPYLSAIRAALVSVLPAAWIEDPSGPFPGEGLDGVPAVLVAVICALGIVIYLALTAARWQALQVSGYLALLFTPLGLAVTILRTLVVVETIVLVGISPTLVERAYPDTPVEQLPFPGEFKWVVIGSLILLFSLVSFARARGRVDRAHEPPTLLAQGPRGYHAGPDRVG